MGNENAKMTGTSFVGPLDDNMLAYLRAVADALGLDLNQVVTMNVRSSASQEHGGVFVDVTLLVTRAQAARLPVHPREQGATS